MDGELPEDWPIASSAVPSTKTDKEKAAILTNDDKDVNLREIWNEMEQEKEEGNKSKSSKIS